MSEQPRCQVPAPHAVLAPIRPWPGSHPWLDSAAQSLFDPDILKLRSKFRRYSSASATADLNPWVMLLLNTEADARAAHRPVDPLSTDTEARYAPTYTYRLNLAVWGPEVPAAEACVRPTATPRRTSTCGSSVRISRFTLRRASTIDLQHRSTSQYRAPPNCTTSPHPPIESTLDKARLHTLSPPSTATAHPSPCQPLPGRPASSCRPRPSTRPP
jgi:hypothetical protein